MLWNGVGRFSYIESSLAASAPESAKDPHHADLAGKKCFVVMPYGNRAGRDGVTRDFEQVFNTFIKPTVEELGIICERSKDRASPGLIHKSMIEQILDWDLCIADITTENENVFYELGIRHTARPSGTVIIRHESARLPFNIGGMRAFSYELENEEKLRHAKSILRDAIVSALVDRGPDSLVHQIIPGLNISRRPQPIPSRTTLLYKLPEDIVASNSACSNKRVGLITGDISYVEGVDIWVNPESTHMEMARVHDDSVSGAIRYYGALKSQTGRVTRDVIARQLRCKLGRIQGAIVEAGTVVVTGAGGLKGPNKVRKVFHVAAQHGEPGRGYVTVRNIEACIRGCMETADSLNSWRRFWFPMRSILFPLFGTRSPGRDSQTVAHTLVQASVSHLLECPRSKLDTVYFLAFTDRDKELCEAAFNRLRLQKI